MKKKAFALLPALLFVLASCGEGTSDSASSTSLQSPSTSTPSSPSRGSSFSSLPLPAISTSDDVQEVLDAAYRSELRLASGGHLLYRKDGQTLQTTDWTVYDDEETLIVDTDSYAETTVLNYREDDSFCHFELLASPSMGNAVALDQEGGLADDELARRTQAYYVIGQDGAPLYGLAGVVSYYLDAFAGDESRVGLTAQGEGFSIDLESETATGAFTLTLSFSSVEVLAGFSAELRSDEGSFQAEGTLSYEGRAEGETRTVDPDDYAVSGFEVDLSMLRDDTLAVGQSLALSIVDETPSLHIPETYSITAIEGDAIEKTGALSIRGVTEGDAAIVVSSGRGVSFTFTLHVAYPEVEGILFDPALPATMNVGDTIEVHARVYPSGVKDAGYNLSLGEGEEDLATLTEGDGKDELTALKPGVLHVIATSTEDPSVTAAGTIEILADDSDERRHVLDNLVSAPYYMDFGAANSIPLVFEEDGTGEVSCVNVYQEKTTWRFGWTLDADLKTIHFSDVALVGTDNAPSYTFTGADATVRNGGESIWMKLDNGDYLSTVEYGRP